MTLYIHKNISNEVKRIHDSKWNSYILRPGKTVIIDKVSTMPGVILVADEKEEPKNTKKRRTKKNKLSTKEED